MNLSRTEEKLINKLKPVSQYNERTALRNDLIKLISLGGFAAGCLIAPGLAHAAKLFPGLTGKENLRLQRQLRSLERRGLIEKRRNKYFLTPKGSLVKNRIDIQEFSLQEFNPKEWDGNWYVLMFDVPISHNRSRASFQIKLKELGYELLQHSIYIHPHNYSKEIMLLAELHDIEIRFLTVSKLDKEMTKKYKKLFKIK